MNIKTKITVLHANQKVGEKKSKKANNGNQPPKNRIAV